MSTNIRRVGLLGFGLMGSGIAQVAASHGFDVLAVDVTGEILARGMERIQTSLGRLVESHEKTGGKTGMAPERKAEILEFIRTSTDRRQLPDCDIVIEAVNEDETVKKALIADLVQLGYDKLLASNTSSVSITRLGAAYSAPEKFMGMHFMNPVPIQPGCELIRGFLTSDETYRTIVEFCREMGKEPIGAEDKAGFGINRMFVPYLNEAAKVVEEGVMSCEDADKTTLCLGHKMGPITTLDYIGLDTALAIARVLETELGPAYKPADLLSKLVAAGCQGIKNGSGFYLWEQGRKIGVNPAVERYRRR